MANTFFDNVGNFYTKHNFPVLLDCNFVVDSTNGNGLGQRNLKGPGVEQIYMNTSATPATGNPNPAAGVILVKLSSNYTRYYGGFSGQVGTIGSTQTTTTANTAYVITALGTATTAQWVAAGLPIGLTPAVGQAFVAIATGTIGGSATVAPSSATGSNIDHIEVLGDPNQTLAPIGLGAGVKGAWLVLQCFKAQAIAAPSNGAVISLAFYLSNSSVFVKGE